VPVGAGDEHTHAIAGAIQSGGLGRRLLLPPAAELLRRGLLRQDQSVATLVRLNDLQRKALADVVAKRVGHRACATGREDDAAVRTFGLDHRGGNPVADCDIRSSPTRFTNLEERPPSGRRDRRPRPGERAFDVPSV
jgi:hypothetical protein